MTWRSGSTSVPMTSQYCSILGVQVIDPHLPPPPPTHPRYKETSRKEGNVLFNDALNTFYLRLYGVTHMVKDHSDSERGNPLPTHGLLFPISSKGSFRCTIPQTGQHIPRPFFTPVVEHWLEREIAHWDETSKSYNKHRAVQGLNRKPKYTHY